MSCTWARGAMSKCFTLGVLFFCLLEVSFAQGGRGTITGVITDISGADVAGAAVSIVSQTTGLETHAVSTSSGVYRAPYLAPDRYRLTVRLRGFKTEIKENI